MLYRFYKFANYSAKQQGTAIFMALLITAIVAAIAVVIMRFQQLDIHRTALMLTSEQAYLYAQGVEYWAKGQLLNEVARAQTANPASSAKTQTKWPILLSPTPIADGQGTIMGAIYDAQGLFNLNNFSSLQEEAAANKQPSQASSGTKTGSQKTPSHKAIDPSLFKPGLAPKQQPEASGTTPPKVTGINIGSHPDIVFKRLLSALNISLSDEQQKRLIAATTAWVSVRMPNTPPDPFDQQYAQMNPPYRSPHSPMVSVSEFRTVAGVTPLIYNRLLPYITALPSNTTLDVRNAPPLLQQALQEQTQQGDATPNSPGTESRQSQYFLLRAEVFFRDQHMIFYSLFQRNTQPNQPPIILVWHSLSTR